MRAAVGVVNLVERLAAGSVALHFGTGLLGLLSVDLLARVDDLFVPVTGRSILWISGRWQGRGGRARDQARGTRGLLRLRRIGTTGHFIAGLCASKGTLLLFRDVHSIFPVSVLVEALVSAQLLRRHLPSLDIGSGLGGNLQTALQIHTLVAFIAVMAVVPDQSIDLLNDSSQCSSLLLQILLQILKLVHHP